MTWTKLWGQCYYLFTPKKYRKSEHIMPKKRTTLEREKYPPSWPSQTEAFTLQAMNTETLNTGILNSVKHWTVEHWQLWNPETWEILNTK